MEKVLYEWKPGHNEPAHIPTPEEIEEKCREFRARDLKPRYSRKPAKGTKDDRDYD